MNQTLCGVHRYIFCPQSGHFHILCKQNLSFVCLFAQLSAVDCSTLLPRCTSRQIFVGAKDFCPNFPKLFRKNFGSLFVRIFSHDDCCWDYLSKSKVFMWFGKRWAPPRWGQFFRKFTQIFRDFAMLFADSALVSTDSARNFRVFPAFPPNQNFWGCSCTPASNTTALLYLNIWVKRGILLEKAIVFATK